jgi:hypothetical protein
MKKLFTLTMLLLCAVVGAKAETETIFSATPTTAWSVPASTSNTEITNSYATISGGKMYLTNAQTSAKDMIKNQGGEIAFQHTNNNTFFKIELNKALKEGDVISVRMQSRTDADLGLWFSTETSRPGTEPTSKIVLATASSSQWVAAPTYTVSKDDGICGETSFYIYRHTGKGTYFNNLVITRTLAATAPEITTQPVSASYKQNATATALTVAATASAGTLTYQWYINTIESTEGSSAISGATSSSLIPATAALGKKYYYCVVSDANGSTNSEFASITVANTSIVGYTEAISGTTLAARSLTSEDANVTISDPSFGSNITDYKGTSKNVSIDGTEYANTDSWRKSQTGAYDNQFVGYTLTVASGYKMNISHVSARIAVADDTYNWYVEILNGAGTQVWKSGEKTTKKASSDVVDADVTTKTAIQGLTGNVTVKLWVKQGGSTKYFSINYLQLAVETEEDVRPTYAMSVSQNLDGVGSVTPTDGAEVTEGESVAFTATPNTEYRFVKWVIDGVDQTANPYVIENVNATHTAIAHFAKRYTVSYELGEYTGTLTGKALRNVHRGNNIDEVYSDDADNYTIPAYADKYLYREGYIFDKWEDGDGNKYDSGDVIAMTKDLTLTPTWKSTSQALSASSTENVVTWTFAKADIVFVDWQDNSKYGYYVQSANVNGESVAVPMSIVKGKVANYTRTDAIAQTNQNTTFTIPAVSGMIVEIIDAYNDLSTTTIAGSTEYTGSGTKSISYTYKGSDATIDIVIGESNQYLKSIKVTYPANLTSISKTISAAGYATLCSEYPLDFTGSDVKAYIATVSSKTVTFTEVTSVPANTGVLLKGTEGDKTIAVAASSTDVSANQLVGVLTDTPVAAGIFVLRNETNGVGFYKTTKEFTVGANTAYLPASVAEGRAFIGFADEPEATGINEVKTMKASNDIYNLKGQRVEKAKKGLYIIGGKKVVMK